MCVFFFSSRRRHTRWPRDWSSDVCSSDLPAIGPTFSGFILANMSWRWMFLTVLPIAVVALVLGAILVKNITTPRSTPVDLASILLSAVTFGGLIYGRSEEHTSELQSRGHLVCRL